MFDRYHKLTGQSNNTFLKRLFVARIDLDVAGVSICARLRERRLKDDGAPNPENAERVYDRKLQVAILTVVLF